MASHSCVLLVLLLLFSTAPQERRAIKTIALEIHTTHFICVIRALKCAECVEDTFDDDNTALRPIIAMSADEIIRTSREALHEPRESKTDTKKIKKNVKSINTSSAMRSFVCNNRLIQTPFFVVRFVYGTILCTLHTFCRNNWRSTFCTCN